MMEHGRGENQTGVNISLHAVSNIGEHEFKNV